MDANDIDPSLGWIAMKDKHYKKQQLQSMDTEFQKLDLEHCKIAVAKFGGPIALCRNREELYISIDDTLKDKIMFYSNNGTLISSVDFFSKDQQKEKIVEFNFIDDELLLVVLASGTYYLINPSPGPNKNIRIPKKYQIDYQFQEQKIQDAKVVQNGFVFISNYQFYFVTDVYDPKVQEFVKTDMKEPIPRSWVTLPSNLTDSGKIEVFYTHEKSGVVQLVESERKTIYYGPPDPQQGKGQQQQQQQMYANYEIKNIQLISFSANCKFASFLTKASGPNNSCKWRVVATDLQHQVKETEVDLQEDQPQPQQQQPNYVKQPQQQQAPEEKIEPPRPLQMLWCDMCVVVVLKRSVYMVGSQVCERLSFKSKGNKFVFCAAEVDGVRIITQKTQELLRMLPEACVNAFSQSSQEPAKKLYESYCSFKGKSPQEDETLRGNKDQLMQAVTDCIHAGSFEAGILQEHLLKAASYGKTFINDPQFDHGQLYEVCKYLRVIKALENEGFKRILTFQQLRHMPPDVLVKILLNYNLHHLAFEISKHLQFDQKLILQIYVHWACCKVESNEKDQIVCELIIDKLKNEKGIPYTKIAHRAIEQGKPDLALRLLEQEPIIAKRVPELLWMAGFDENIKEFESVIMGGMWGWG